MIAGQWCPDEGQQDVRMSKAQEYRERAEECRRESEQCCTPVEKNHWLVLADQWLSMAQDLDLRLHKSNASGNG
jgi:hypothetical protein